MLLEKNKLFTQYKRNQKKAKVQEYSKYQKSLNLQRVFNKAFKEKDKTNILYLKFLIETFNKKNGQPWPIDLDIDYSNLSAKDWKSLENKIKFAIKTLREASQKKEALIKKQEIDKAIQNRCHLLKNDQKRMIISLLGSKKDSVKINRILIQENSVTSSNSIHNYISTQPEVIAEHTVKYYKQAFRKRNIQFNNLNNKWKKEYEPLTSINQEWFKDLTNEIQKK